MSPVSTLSVGINVYLADTFSCADGANTAGTRSRNVSIDSEALNALPRVTVANLERLSMMDSSRCSWAGLPASRGTRRAQLSIEGDGSWNKWRGPALRGEVAVYAAKARRHSIDQRARRVRVTTTEIPPLFSPHFIHRHRACVRAVACSTESCPFAAPRMISPDASFSIRS